MALVVGEADDLVLDRGAIARAACSRSGRNTSASDAGCAGSAHAPPRVVAVIWQSIWGVSIRAVRKDIGSGGQSPGWRSSAAQSMVRPSSRGGVPVLSRPRAKPSRSRVADSPRAGASPTRPAGVVSVADMDQAAEEGAGGQDHGAAARISPVARRHRRRHGHRRSSSDPRPPPAGSRASAAPPAGPGRPGDRACGRPGRGGRGRPGPCSGSASGTGCRPRSIARAIIPSRASISRTRWPLASPPMAGLQDISPMVAGLWVTSRVRAPTARRRRRGLAAGVAAADDDDVKTIHGAGR